LQVIGYDRLKEAENRVSRFGARIGKL
jgi:hypothetical protein